ncbi:MAG: thioredoxin family protein [Planctomycetota bacterium]|jgi:thiol-disulfide isomerase/thioredoxin|nr:thioredoxin family protein [Planctomycetota bacterium]
MRRIFGWLAVCLVIAGCASSSGGGGAVADGAVDLASRFPSGVTVIYFHSTSCESCKYQDRHNPEITPDLNALNVGFVKIAPNNATIKKYGIRRYPTLMVLRDGRETQRFTGVTYREDLLPAVRSALGQ